MLKLKTSQQQPAKPNPKQDTKKPIQKEAPKQVQDIEDEQDDSNLIVVKKTEKKSVPLTQQPTEGWQQQDDVKDLPTNGIGKKPAPSAKKQEEQAVEIKNEEFPDLSVAVEAPQQTKKQQKMQQNQAKQEVKQQAASNNQGSFFMNSGSSKPTQQTTQQQPQLNIISGPVSFTNTKKDENAVKFQQIQEEQTKKIQPEPVVEKAPEPQTKAPPAKIVNFQRNANAVVQPPPQEPPKQLKVEEAVPTFINSKAKVNPPIAQQQPQQPVVVQEQKPVEQNEEEDDGWEVVEPKKKNQAVAISRNIKRNQ